MPKVIGDGRIFGAAIHALMSLGYDGTTTREVADAAGVNEVTLFRRYRSKAGLFESAIRHWLSDTPLSKVAFTGGLETDMRAIVQAYVETNETYGDIVAIILIELQRHPDLQGSITTPWKNIQGITRIIREYQKRGLLKSEPPLAALSALVGPIMVGQMLRRAGLNLPVPALDPPAHVDAFLNGRKPRTRTSRRTGGPGRR
jgi:AcrR family transcriptional regulator